jgi:hypothetical protein
MTAVTPEKPESMRTSLRHVRRDVRELKAQYKELRRWMKAITALLITVAASVAGAIVSSGMR